MSKTKDAYYEHFATYDYIDMPTVDYEIEWLTWKRKEERMEKLLSIFEKI